MTSSKQPGASVRSLFDRALQLPIEERESFLVQACGSDEGKVARVRQLLAAHERSAFLDEPLVTPLRTAIGPYRVLERLGEGGMGEVFLAERAEPDTSRVAVKVIKLGMDTRAVLQRFAQEHRVLAMLDHESIAAVHEAGATEDGRPYFAMEYVRGTSLVAFCDRRNMALRERIELFIRVCRAVQHAHQKGVIHRDLKPSNILVTEQDGAIVPKVIDFGVAKAAVGTPAQGSVFTRIGEMVGTPDYMSPEQADPQEEDIDTRSDVYSLGVVLYELLVGRLPLGESLRGVDSVEARQRILDRQPQRLSAVPESGAATVAAARGTDVKGLLRTVRGDLDAILFKCLAKDRSDRYDSAAELATDLRRFLDYEPVSATPPGVGYRLRKFTRKHRTAVVVASAVLLSLVAMGAWAWLEKGRAAVALARARAMTDFLTETLRNADPYVAGGLDTKLLVSIADDAADRLEAGELADFPEAEIELRTVLAKVFIACSAYERLAAVVAPLAAMRARYLHGDSQLHVEVITQLAGMQVNTRTQDALRLYDEALAMRRRLPMDEPHKLVWLLIYRSNALNALGRIEQVLASCDEVLALRNEYGLHARFAIAALLRKARCLQKLRRVPEALPIATRALALAKNTDGGLLYDTVHGHDVVGWLLLGLEKPAEARGHFEKSLAVMETLGTDRTSFGAHMVRSVGLALRDEGRHAEAVAQMRRALEISEQLHDDGTLVAAALTDLAKALIDVRQLDEALQRSEQAVVLRRKLHGGDHPDIGGALFIHARCLEALDRFVAASENYDEAAAIWEKFFAEPRQDAPRALLASGQALFSAGRFGDALRRFEAAAEKFARVPGAGSGSRWARRRAGECLWRLQRFDEAAAAFDAVALQMPAEGRGRDPDWAFLLVARAEMWTARSAFAEATQLLNEADPTAMHADARPDLKKHYIQARVFWCERSGDEAGAKQWRARL